MPAATKPKTINQRMLAAMGSIGDIPKNGRNEFHNYDFVTAHDVNKAVRAAMVEHGIMAHISTVGSEVEVVPGKDGRSSIMAVAWGTLAFVNSEDATDLIVDEWRGMSVDTSDKALAKATTSGIKYGLMNALLIGSEDTDSDRSSPEVGDMRRQAQDTYGDMSPPPPMTHSDAPAAAGRCPKHNKEWRSNSRGWYCSTKDPSTESGWCTEHPSSEWQQANER